MFQKVLKQSFLRLMVTWDRPWTTCKRQTVDLVSSTKKMFSRSLGRNFSIVLALIFELCGFIFNFLVGFQVCDQPHPLHVKNMVRNVIEGKFDDACASLKQLYDLGYSPTDIITTLFRIIKNYDMAEYLKLEFMKVCLNPLYLYIVFSPILFYLHSLLLDTQETGFAHMRICDGVGSYLQLCGLLAKLALVRETAKAA